MGRPLAGERQRVLIARALMAKPAVLILDEPCAGLDPVAREHFLDFLQRLAAQKSSPPPFRHAPRGGKSPAITTALLLREGRSVAAGHNPNPASKNLTHTFAAPLRLRQARNRYTLQTL